MTLRTALILSVLAFSLLIPAAAQEPPDAQQSPSSVQPVADQPLTIGEAVQRSISRNLTVEAARERVDQARAGVDIARSGRLPTLELQAQYNRLPGGGTFELPSPAPGVPPQMISISSTENTTATIQAAQAIYTGGRVTAQISQARAFYDTALGDLAATEAQTALQTRESYYNALLGLSLISSQEQNLAAAGQQLRVAQDKFEVGTAAQFDVLRAQTTVSEAEQSLEEARNQARSAELNLNRLIAAPIAQDQQLVQPVTAPFPEEDVEALVDTALRQRGEVLAARARFAAAEAGIDIARSERRPQIGVAAGYQVVSNESPAQTTGLTFAATATLPIYEGGRIRANIRQSTSARDESRANLEETLLTVEQDVRQQHLNLQTARQTIQTAESRLAQAQEAYQIATVRYEAGVGTAVEVADALATLAAARTNLDQARFNYNIAYARLQRALGVVTF